MQRGRTTSRLCFSPAAKPASSCSKQLPNPPTIQDPRDCFKEPSRLCCCFKRLYTAIVYRVFVFVYIEKPTEISNLISQYPETAKTSTEMFS